MVRSMACRWTTHYGVVYGVQVDYSLWCGLWCAGSRRPASRSRTRIPGEETARPPALLCRYLEEERWAVKTGPFWSVMSGSCAFKSEGHLPLKFRLFILKFRGANGFEETIFPPEKTKEKTCCGDFTHNDIY